MQPPVKARSKRSQSAVRARSKRSQSAVKAAVKAPVRAQAGVPGVHHCWSRFRMTFIPPPVRIAREENICLTGTAMMAARTAFAASPGKYG